MPLIAANDSHYIYPEQIVQRKQLQVGKNISYKDEDEFLLDYPDIDTFFRRFQDQNVLSYNQISTAIENTLIFDDCEDIELDYEVKMPSIYKHLTEDEKIKELKNIINVKFPIVMKQDGIDKEHRKLYAQEIRKEMQVIEDTKSLHTADYFLFNNKMVELAVNKHGGTLTRSGRGSGGAFLINKILGITQIDRLDVFLPIYSERFMSTSRLLENKASPDIDYNCATQEPFVKAMRELLGEKNCYPMLAYGTMKLSEAFRNVCRSKNLDYEEYNEIAKKIDEEIPSGKWEEIVKEAKNYIGTIINASVHPCAFLLLNEDIESEIGVVRIGDAICAMITSGEADEYKYLKNDILVVTVWDIISQVFKEINKPILSVKELKENLTPEIWELLAQGYTATLNQVDGDWATSMLMQYKPKSIEELSMFVGAIRPSFENFRETFLKRQPYTTGSEELDQLFSQTNHFIIFQENLMQYFEWLGVSPAESIGLIKKISKKKIKPQDFESLEKRLETQWVKNTGSIDKFHETWQSMQAMMNYGFNSPHGLATALDCLYGAYLKQNYPLQYYTTVLNIYQDNQTKVASIEAELPHFHIKMHPIKFGRSRAQYSYDIEENAIYKGVASLKYFNHQAAEDLYTFSQTLTGNETFVDLLYKIKETIKIDSRKMTGLIVLKYFSYYGSNQKLLKIYHLFEELYGKSTLSKEKLSKYNITPQMLSSISAKETKKQYSNINMHELLNLLSSSIIDASLDLQTQISYEIEYLGSPISTYDCPLNNYIITNLEIRYSTPIVTMYELNKGETVTSKVDKKISYKNKECLLNKMDIISIPKIDKKNKFKKNDDGTFTMLDTTENIIKHFVLVKKFNEKEK